MTLFAVQQEAQARYDLCKECDRFTATTKRCRECGCFMRVKVTLQHSTCPLGKW